MAGLVPATHALFVARQKDVGALDAKAVTPVFDALYPGMTSQDLRA
jgi:hypothetical protein